MKMAQCFNVKQRLMAQPTVQLRVNYGELLISIHLCYISVTFMSLHSGNCSVVASWAHPVDVFRQR